MNKHKCFLGLAILATLVTTPAQAEEVSRKAADLMSQNSNSTDSVDQNTNNTQPVNTPASTYKSGDTDSKLPASRYYYLSGSVGSAAPGNNLQGSSSFNNKISLALDSTSQWNIAFGYQKHDLRSEAEISYSSFGVVEFKYLGIGTYQNDAGRDVTPPNSYGVNVGYRQGF